MIMNITGLKLRRGELAKRIRELKKDGGSNFFINRLENKRKGLTARIIVLRTAKKGK